MPEEDRERLVELLQARDKKRSAERRRLLAKHPELAAVVGDGSRVTETALIAAGTENIGGVGDALGEAAKYKCDAMRRELGHAEASELERLLIDRLVATWLHVQHVESLRTSRWRGGGELTHLTFYDREASRANTDFLKACTALARVRKLLRPTVTQVNIATQGGQQVNMAEASD